MPCLGVLREWNEMVHKEKEMKRNERNGSGVIFFLFGCLKKKKWGDYLFFIWELSESE